MSYQPTIIGGLVTKPEPQKTYQPTKIIVDSKVNESQPQQKPAFKITAMKGHVRKSLDPNGYDLENRFPNVKNIEQLKLKISGIVIDVLDANECGSLGRSIQSEFMNMLNQIFKISESSCIAHAQRHVERLTKILSDAIESLENGNGFLWKKIDTKSILTSVVSELNLLKTLLINSVEDVNNAKTESISYASRMLDMENEIYVCSSLIEILDGEVASDDLKNILLQRGISIEKTKVQIINQIRLMESMIVSMDSLIDMIQNAVNVQLPGLMQCIMTAMQSDMNDTQKYLVSDSLKTFITSLTKKDIS